MPHTSNIAILWFRRDLRLHDNPALNWVCENCKSVLPVYIHAPEEEQPWPPGGASRWWLHNSLAELDTQLRGHGLRLHFFTGSSEKTLNDIITKTKADSLVYNNLYEPHLASRDTDLCQKLEHRILIKTFDSGLFFKPGTVLNNQQSPYKVFTPFYRKVRPLIDKSIESTSNRITRKQLTRLSSSEVSFAIPLHSLELLDTHNWHTKLGQYWKPGEKNGLKMLDDFVEESLSNYKANRDIPSVAGTSRLSAHLHFGEISPRQIYSSMQPALNDIFAEQAIGSAEVYLKQLLWREFAYHVLWHYPHTATQAMNSRYNNTFWRTDKKKLLAWQRGKTGIAIIDAGMKQLWETGWMHNRVRMIASSFLTKNLGINWLDGARWFWETLVDADLANNSMGWQWVAGCGVDAAPYFRIFNPDTQAKRFDPYNHYIETWIPGYRPTDYINRIVDPATSRKKALERYKQYFT